MFKSLSLGGLSWKELARRVWSEIQEDEVLGRAAQLSYYFLLALFPLLLFLTSLLGWIAGEDAEMRSNLFKYLGAVLPGEASQLISKTVNDVTEGSGGGKLSLGILATLWAASNGMGAIIDTLNVAYEVKETRPWWRARLTAIFLTFVLAALILTALVLVLYGHDIAETLAGKLALGAMFTLAWKILQWPIVLIFVLIAFAIIYYFAPSVEDQDWKWVTPGSLIGVAIWLLVSFAFRTYLQFFNSYSATYGSLGAVIILMLWFYFTGAAILIGGEINSEVENEMAKRGAPDAKEKGEKTPNENESAGGAQAQRQGASGTQAATARARVEAKADAKVAASAGDRPGTRESTGVEARRSAGVKVDSGSGGGASQIVSGRVTRMPHDAKDGRGFSIGKAFIVLGAWALSRFRRGRAGK